MPILVYPFKDDAGVAKYQAVFNGWADRGKVVDAYINAAEFGNDYVPLCLASAIAASTIIILGHCSSGSEILRSETSYLAKRTDERPGETIRAGALAVLLKELGLNDNATTTIKCLNCSSGVHFDGYHLEASFATSLKAALARQDILLGNIHVYGYLGELILVRSPMKDVRTSTGQLADINNSVLSVFPADKKAFRGSQMRFEATGDAQTDKRREMALWNRIQGPGTVPY